ncbi:MAG: hypothetical protein DHS20C15_23150 [Planctomycetota bacterium]|nr:MAG: hypothetical protein DHS20C15_23150 [Planctomycetota bacterium]
MASKPLFHDLCCVARATLFNLCVSDADLLELGVWDESPHASGYSPGVRCRAELHARTQSDEALNRRVRDRLDLQYLDTLMVVRGMDDRCLTETVDSFLEDPEHDPRALPALLYALCTDDRSEVRALGVQLSHEAITMACRELVEPSRAESQS